MKETGISKGKVEQCLDSPDKPIQNGEMRFVKEINQKVLAVIYKVEKGDKLVMTAFVSSKISKYLSH